MSEFNVQAYLERAEASLAGLPHDVRTQGLEAFKAYLEASSRILDSLPVAVRAEYEAIRAQAVDRAEASLRQNSERYKRNMTDADRYKNTPERYGRLQEAVHHEFEIFDKAFRNLLEIELRGLERELKERGF